MIEVLNEVPLDYNITYNLDREASKSETPLLHSFLGGKLRVTLTTPVKDNFPLTLLILKKLF